MSEPNATPTMQDNVNVQQGLKDDNGLGDTTVVENNGEEVDGADDNKIVLTPEQLAERIDRAARKAVREAEKKQSEAERLAGMTKAQREAEEREALQKRITELESAQVRSEMTSQARAKLSEAGIQTSDEMISVLVTNDAESTMSNIDLFTAEVQKAAEKSWQKARIGQTPSSASGAQNGEELSFGKRMAQKFAQNKNTTAPDLWAK